MTVSPKWPQDGNRQPKGVGRGVESDPGPRQPALPPTLFALPNLSPGRPAATTPRPSQSKPVVAVPAASSTTVDRKSPSSAVPVGEDRQTDVDDSPKPPMPPAVAETAATPATTTTGSSLRAEREHLSVPSPKSKSPPQKTFVPAAAPAHRSWLETLGSHGVIAVLLLVVVAAALMSGRDSDDAEHVSSLAEYGELLDFEDGTQVDLPLAPRDLSAAPDSTAPTQAAKPVGVDEETSPAFTSLLASTPKESTAAASSFADVASVDQALPPTVSIDGDSVAMDSDGSEPADVDESVVSLEVPQASSSVAEPTWQPGLESSHTSRVQINEFMSAPANVGSLAANRTAVESDQSELPSLEELDGASTRDAESNMANQTGPTPVLSKTPVGVRDWSKYLPSLQRP